MNRIDRSMTIWMVSMIIMVVVILPATVVITAAISHAQRQAALDSTESKPVPTFEDTETYQPEERLIIWHSANDTFHRTYKGGKFYYNAHKHTYRAAQLVVMPYGVNYITEYVRTNICRHGEYRHIAIETCCPQ